MRKLSVAVVGCGWNSDKHLRVYSHTKNVRLAAVCDNNRGKAEQKASIFRARQVFTDYESMLKLDLDLVDIVTPPSTHARMAELALESGHNVLVEKPMAISSSECQKMISATRRNGRALCVMHTKRFFDCVVRTKAFLEREGLIVSRMRFSHFFALPYAGFGSTWILKEEFGGVLWDSLVHHVYLTEYFLGNTLSVYAVADKVRESVSDSITLVIKTQGKTGLCEFQWNVREPLQVLELLTSEGDRFDLDLPHDLLLRRSRPYKGLAHTVVRSFSDDLRDPLIKWTNHLRNLIVMRPYQKALPFERTFFTLIRQFLSYLNGHASTPPVTAEEGLQTIKVLEAARKSMETGGAEVPV